MKFKLFSLFVILFEGSTTPMAEELESNDLEGVAPCEQPMDYGKCESYIHKWYFNNETGRCEVFVYGGCQGNRNRFNSELVCWRTCVDANASECMALAF